SAAVAHVSAAAALLLSIDDWTPAEIRTHLNESTDRPSVLWGTCISNGRLNLRRAVCGPFHIVAPAGGQGLPHNQLLNVQWTLEYTSTIVTDAEISFIDKTTGNVLGTPVVTPAVNLSAQVMVPNAPGVQAFVRVKGVQKNLYAESAPFNII